MAATAAEAAGVSLPPPPPQSPYHVLEKVSAETVTLRRQWQEGAWEHRGGPGVARPAQRGEDAGRRTEVGCRQEVRCLPGPRGIRVQGDWRESAAATPRGSNLDFARSFDPGQD